jgi:membrane protease YdiL (CAAX protease family)
MPENKNTISISRWIAIWAASEVATALIILLTKTPVSGNEIAYTIQSMVFSFSAVWVLSSLGIDVKTEVLNYATAGKDFRLAAKYFFIYAVIIISLIMAVAIAMTLMVKANIFSLAAIRDYLRIPASTASSQSHFQTFTINSSWRLFLYLFSSSVIIPIEEEIFYRRFLFASLRRSLSFAWTLLISSAIFGAVHLADAVPAFAAGIFLGWIYERKNNLPVNIMVHGLINLASTLVMIYFATR